MHLGVTTVTLSLATDVNPPRPVNKNSAFSGIAPCGWDRKFSCFKKIEQPALQMVWTKTAPPELVKSHWAEVAVRLCGAAQPSL